jgi:hypothetical protein
MLHGKGNHSTEECRNMQAQAKRMKTNGGDSKPSGSKNKTWNRKDGDKKKVTFGKNEINTLVKKAAKKAAKKEINALSKKRKSEDSDSEEEMNNIEERIEDMDLNDFNSEDLKRVLDDDEFSDEIST